MNKIHDSGYQYLFRQKTIMRRLLEGFIPFSWVADIDFDRMELQNSSFIRKNYRKRESDVIYKLFYKDKPFYIYILLEFQSTVDYWMAFRMLSYEIDLYEEIIKREKPNKLPVVFPILIYNGDERWTAPYKLGDLIETVNPELKAYLPSFKYFKIIINEFSKETLFRIRNILSAVFLVENASENELNAWGDDIVSIILEEIDEDTRMAFVNWFSHLVDDERISSSEKIENVSIKEVQSMFAKTVESMKSKYRKEGIQQGMQLGIQQGMQQGMQQGIKQGMRHGMEKIALNLLKEGMGIEKISKITSLGVDHIKKLSKMKK